MRRPGLAGGKRIWGLIMRKSILFALAALLVAALPTLAEAAKKKAAPADPNEPGRRLVVDGLSQIFVPAQSVVAASQPKPAAKKGKKKKM
jgi:hypothetical protein